MPQVPKEEMRRAILDAEELAEVGFEKATLASIAARGGTSIGNLYKYFANKDQLFQAAIPPEIANELAALVRGRVEGLGGARDVRELGPSHPWRVASDALLSFTIAHRARIVFLLGHAEGTPYASFSEELVQSLTQLAVEYFGRAYPEAKLTASQRRALVRVYRAFVASMTAMLREETSERALREASAHYGTYHLAGLKAFFEAS